MRRITRSWVAFLAVWLILTASCMWAQEKSEAAKQPTVATNTATAHTGPFYHLEFVVKEVDGSKVINSRSYSTSISEGGYNSIRAGARVPVATGLQSTYLDLGANFDCSRARDVEGKLALRVIAELSNIASSEQEGTARTQPVIHQNKWDAEVIVLLGKPTTIFSSDDVSSKSKMQVELTATLIR